MMTRNRHVDVHNNHCLAKIDVINDAIFFEAQSQEKSVFLGEAIVNRSKEMAKGARDGKNSASRSSSRFLRISSINLECNLARANNQMNNTRLKVIHSSHCGIGSQIRRILMTMLTFFYCVILLAGQCTVALGLDCFVCSSRNGSNPLCEDPFHNLQPIRVTTPLIPDRHKPKLVYHAPCYTSRKNRDGLFPASACLKLAGTFENGETLIVRHCGLDSGTLTQDTEIVRMSHCGSFQLDGQHLRGCVMACSTDACNRATKKVAINHLIVILIMIITTVSISSLKRIDVSIWSS